MRSLLPVSPAFWGRGTRIALAVAWVALLLIPAVVLFPRTASAQSCSAPSFHWDPLNVNIDINQDGTFNVEEDQSYVYTGGTANGGYRDIEQDRLDSITDISVSETGYGDYRRDDSPFDLSECDFNPAHTYSVVNNDGQLRIIWFYGRTPAPQTKNMVIKYKVIGGLRYYPDGDQFYWSPLLPNRTAPIYTSQVTVNVPDNIDLTSPDARSAVYPPSTAEIYTTTHQIVFTPLDAVQGGTNFEVRVQWPHGLISGSAPAWQAGYDASREYDERWRPLVNLILSGVAVLALIGGILFFVMRWYRAGRDPVVGMVADYLPDPPSDLPAGLVGTLVDESADVRDVIGSLLDLARKGHLTIREIKEGGIGGLFQNTDFEYTLVNPNVKYPFEGAIINAVFGGGNTRRLSDLKNKFYSKLPSIYSGMYQALAEAKYFERSPEATRGSARALAGGVFVLAIIAGCAAIMFGDTIGNALWGLPVVLALVAVVGFIMAGAMPRKTEFGADQAARWRAFGRYLRDLQRFNGVANAAQRFDQFLPYAVALGVENEYVNQFNNVQTPINSPTWYIPWGWNYGPYYGGGQSGSSTVPMGNVPTGPGGGFDINTINQSLVGSIQGLNNSITSMINSASSALTSAPSSSGGGGGGFSGGGGGGGSGGGGGGGGSF